MPFDGNPMPDRQAAARHPHAGAALPEAELLREVQGVLTAMAGSFGLVAAAGVMLLAWG